MNFAATNNFKCPHCNEMLNGASGYDKQDKPQHDSFTVCSFCATLCVYVIHEGNISLRKPEEADHEFIKKYGLQKDIDHFIDFVKSKPK